MSFAELNAKVKILLIRKNNIDVDYNHLTNENMHLAKKIEAIPSYHQVYPSHTL